MQLRALDTGSAKDVSGVIRVSRGGGDRDTNGSGNGQEESKAGNDIELTDSEWLYQVKGDGSVRVWGRGE